MIHILSKTPMTTRFKLLSFIFLSIYKISISFLFRTRLPKSGTFMNVKQYLGRNTIDIDPIQKMSNDHEVVIKELVSNDMSSDLSSDRGGKLYILGIINKDQPGDQNQPDQKKLYIKSIKLLFKRNIPFFMNLAVSSFIIIIFLHELYLDCKLALIFLAENILLCSFTFFGFSIFFFAMVFIGKPAFYLELMYEDFVRHRILLFLDTLVFDSFITFFLVYFLFLKECTKGKKLERIMSRYKWYEYFQLNLIFTLTAISVAENYFYHKLDNDMTLLIRLFSLFFSLCFALDRTASFISIYLLFIVGQGFTLLMNWIFPENFFLMGRISTHIF